LTVSSNARARVGRALAWALGIAVTVSACGREADERIAHYRHGDRDLALTVALDRIVLVGMPGTSRAEIDAMGRELGGSIEHAYGNDAYALAVKRAASRIELVQLARRALRAGGGRIARAGLQVIPEGKSAPSLVSDELIVRLRDGVSRSRAEGLLKPLGIAILHASPFDAQRLLLRVTDAAPGDVFAMAARLGAAPVFSYSHPDFVALRPAPDDFGRPPPPRLPGIRPRPSPPSLTPILLPWRPTEVRLPLNVPVVPEAATYALQWHHENTGQHGGAPDADIDTPKAWAFTRGKAEVVVAVIDSGFEVTHPDLAGALWSNEAERTGVPGDGSCGGEQQPACQCDKDGDGVCTDCPGDDDHNCLVDDLHGWDFTACTAQLLPGCGDRHVQPFDPPNLAGAGHGTAAAGLIAAARNGDGIVGVCPGCRLLLLSWPSDSWGQAEAMDYARSKNASIVSNSWYDDGAAENDAFATAVQRATCEVQQGQAPATACGRAGRGAVVLMAMHNGSKQYCAPEKYVSRDDVIAVGRATNRDLPDESANGDCLDLLAPSANTIPYSSEARGTLWMATTDLLGSAGYNDGSAGTGLSCDAPALPGGKTWDAYPDYTPCFSGTSAATPVTAGVAGLVLSMRRDLTRTQVQRLLQDTADRIAPERAHYDSESGFSSAPAAGKQQAGWGRINAFEAVRLVAPGVRAGPAAWTCSCATTRRIGATRSSRRRIMHAASTSGSMQVERSRSHRSPRSPTRRRA
jgi:subtilisin family serine protease